MKKIALSLFLSLLFVTVPAKKKKSSFYLSEDLLFSPIRQERLNSKLIGTTSYVYQLSSLTDKGALYYWFQPMRNSTEAFSLVFSPTGHVLATGGKGAVCLWRTDEENSLAAKWKTGQKGNITAVAFNKSGNTLIGGSDRDILFFWDVEKGKLTGSLELSEVINDIAVFPYKNAFVCVTNSEVHLIQDGLLVKSHSIQAVGVSINNTGEYVALGTSSGIEIWDKNLNSQVMPYSVKEGVTDVCFHPNGAYVSATSSQGNIYTWFVRSSFEEPYHTLNASENPLTALSYFYDADSNKTLISAVDGKGHLSVWDVSRIPPDFEVWVKEYTQEKFIDWVEIKESEPIEEYMERIIVQKAPQGLHFRQDGINKYQKQYQLTSSPVVESYDEILEVLPMRFENSEKSHLKMSKDLASSLFSVPDKLIFDSLNFELMPENNFAIKSFRVSSTANTGSFSYVNHNIEEVTEDTLDFPMDSAIFVATESELLLKDTLGRFGTTGATYSIRLFPLITINPVTRQKELTFHLRYSFHATEGTNGDYTVGNYQVFTSKATQQLLKFIGQSLIYYLHPLMNEEKPITINIKALATKKGENTYQQEYGVLNNESVYLNKNLWGISADKNTTLSPANVAALRTIGLERALKSNASILRNMKSKYIRYAETSVKESKQPNVQIEFILHNISGEQIGTLNKYNQKIRSELFDMFKETLLTGDTLFVRDTIVVRGSDTIKRQVTQGVGFSVQVLTQKGHMRDTAILKELVVIQDLQYSKYYNRKIFKTYYDALDYCRKIRFFVDDAFVSFIEVGDPTMRYRIDNTSMGKMRYYIAVHDSTRNGRIHFQAINLMRLFCRITGRKNWYVYTQSLDTKEEAETFLKKHLGRFRKTEIIEVRY